MDSKGERCFGWWTLEELENQEIVDEYEEEEKARLEKIKERIRIENEAKKALNEKYAAYHKILGLKKNDKKDKDDFNEAVELGPVFFDQVITEYKIDTNELKAAFGDSWYEFYHGMLEVKRLRG